MLVDKNLSTTSMTEKSSSFSSSQSNMNGNNHLIVDDDDKETQKTFGSESINSFKSKKSILSIVSLDWSNKLTLAQLDPADYANTNHIVRRASLSNINISKPDSKVSLSQPGTDKTSLSILDSVQQNKSTQNSTINSRKKSRRRDSSLPPQSIKNFVSGDGVNESKVLYPDPLFNQSSSMYVPNAMTDNQDKMSYMSADNASLSDQPHRILRIYDRCPNSQFSIFPPGFYKNCSEMIQSTARSPDLSIIVTSNNQSVTSLNSINSNTALNIDFTQTVTVCSDCHIKPEELPILDYIDATNEESFSLETFESLMKACAMSNKYFILARVTTADPNDESKIYYSYYDAHHINKVLFRSQPEQSLLHRMKAKNPLNNMPIIGKVLYFTVAKDETHLAHKKYHRNKMRRFVLENLKSNEMTKDSTHSLEAPHDEELYGIYPQSLKAHSSIDSKSSDYQEILTKYKNAIYKLKNQGLIGSDDQQLLELEIEEDSSINISIHSNNMKHQISSAYGDNVIIYRAYFYATDEDYLMQDSVRQFFKSNSLLPADHELFPLYGADQLNRRMGQMGPLGVNGDVMINQMAEGRNFYNCCGLLTARSRSFRRRVMASVIIGYVALAALVILLIVPDTLKLLVTISLIVLLGLIIIIFIDSERHLQLHSLPNETA